MVELAGAEFFLFIAFLIFIAVSEMTLLIYVTTHTATKFICNYVANTYFIFALFNYLMSKLFEAVCCCRPSMSHLLKEKN